MDEWIQHAIKTLKKWWPNLVHQTDTNWILLKKYPIPEEWGCDKVDIAFKIPPGFPGEHPYAFWVKDGLTLPGGGTPTNYAFPETEVPFEGKWGKFSWEFEPWEPGETPGKGTNMVQFAQSFLERLREIK